MNICEHFLGGNRSGIQELYKAIVRSRSNRLEQAGSNIEHSVKSRRGAGDCVSRECEQELLVLEFFLH